MPKSRLRVRCNDRKTTRKPIKRPYRWGAAADAAAPTLPRVLGWKQRHQMIGLLFLLPAVVYVVVFYVYPILLNIVMSLERYTAKSFVTGEAPL